MIEVVLKRVEKSKDFTKGFLIVSDGLKIHGKWCTLELPDKGNKARVSCIPEGEYLCEFTLSQSLKFATYYVNGVPGRSGIRIHSGNYTRQIFGCILLGKDHTDIDKDGIIDVTDSRMAVAEFEKVMGKQKFKLKIIY